MTLDELRQLDPKDPGRWPLPVRLGVIAAFFVVLAAALAYFVVWNSKKDELASYEADERKLRTEFRDKHGKAVNLELYKEQLEQINENFGMQLRQLPGKTEVDNLLTDISTTGAGAGLEQQVFDPMPDEIRDFYAIKPIKIRFVGSYHEMGQFVSEIAKLRRIVTLHDVVIKPVDRGSFDQLQMDLTARTYRYLDDQEKAAADAAKAKQQAAARGSSSS